MIVYLITNIMNGKRYVGWTSKSLEVRWRQHSRRNSNCFALQSAINKYGRESFITETLFDVSTKEQAVELEIEYIERYRTVSPNGYNLTTGGEGTAGDCEEVRRKKSLANIGNKHAVGAVRTPEYLKALSERFKGRVFSEETKRKMSEAASARKDTPETKAKKSNSSKRLGLRPPVLTTEQLAEAGRISGHKRYHVNRNIKKAGCKLCEGI